MVYSQLRFLFQIDIDIEPNDKVETVIVLHCFSIQLDPTLQVERIKERVEEKEGIPPPQQRLGRILSFLRLIIVYRLV